LNLHGRCYSRRLAQLGVAFWVQLEISSVQRLDLDLVVIVRKWRKCLKLHHLNSSNRVESICQTTWNRRLIFPSPNNQCDWFPCSLSYAYCNLCIHGRCIGDCFQANASTQCLGFHVWLSQSFLDEQQSKRICCMESFATSSRGDLSLNWLQQKNAKDR
jgi:hypothetical protein